MKSEISSVFENYKFTSIFPDQILKINETLRVITEISGKIHAIYVWFSLSLSLFFQNKRPVVSRGRRPDRVSEAMLFPANVPRLIHRWYLRANRLRLIKFSRSCVRVYEEKLAKGKRRRIGRQQPRHCQIRLSHARRPCKRKKRKRSGRTKNKTVVKKGRGGRGEGEEGGGIRGKVSPTLSTGRVSAGLRPRSRILMGRRHLVLLCRYPLPANPMSCHPFA